MSAYFFASNFWNAIFAFGMTTVFMNSRRWSAFMSFHGTAGAPDLGVDEPHAASNRNANRYIAFFSHKKVTRCEAPLVRALILVAQVAGGCATTANCPVYQPSAVGAPFVWKVEAAGGTMVIVATHQGAAALDA